ncbi:4-hydroxyphenylacetate 3-monooxygenase, oxygenase component [Paenibacillus ginsengarvi]|uniref:4-hydroxyphenylacetate 3-monooxygenase, oxygenase component n=1 Tax=Paenibacillus ginsengarvi TaxID=400777 RepID=A0A3B0CLJ7_9BACL|nr:4-hydroxyphenylacetate 3-monooxygenase, oxygenase component [Paenibacillus ginsengarvi]RKN84876.1 4-hydroxyphenylacetate 3-monooxygenase, oxygenase component [Paenibacillus ginsengarvi]
MPIKNGEQYIAGIDKGGAQVWVDGNRVTGAISEHSAFRGVVSTQAELYDMQGADEYLSRMTYESPTSGDVVGLSFLRPQSKRDLRRRREMMTLWAGRHHGFLGRAPDYMNTVVMAFGAAWKLLAESNPMYGDNMRRYYEHCRENDITLSHAFIVPHAGRMSSFLKTLEQPDAPRVEETNKDGIVVSGAFLLATQAATADEILIFPAPLPSAQEVNPHAFAFAVPSGLPGIRYICRESFAAGTSEFDYPLSSRYEEMDTLVVFDRVLVPHDRVFLCGDEDMAYRFTEESRFHTHATHQVLCRNIAKTEFMLGVIEGIIKLLGLRTYTQVVEKAAEAIAGLETLKALLVASEAGARKDRWGTMLPSPGPLYTANYLYPKMYPRLVEIVQLLGASGIVVIPSEADFHSDIGGDLHRYLKGIETDAKSRVGLFRLAWDLSASSFAGRQTLYERFFFGDSVKVASRLYSGYTDKEKFAKKVAKLVPGLGRENASSRVRRSGGKTDDCM